MAKVFISFLGTSPYQETTYQMPNGFQKQTQFVQIGILASLKEEKIWQEGTDNRIHILLTKEAEVAHWSDLKKQIEDLDNTNVRLVPIKDFSSNNIPEQIKSIIDTINDDDEVYFDITHGFRSLSFVAMVALNYLSIIKNISVKKVLYGEYDRNNPVNQVQDITKLIELQQWTFAARDFAEFGSTKSIAKLAAEKSEQIRLSSPEDLSFKNWNGLAKQIKKINGLFETCQGPDILSGATILPTTKKIQESGKDSTDILFFDAIGEKLLEHLSSFSDSKTQNLKLTLEWCLDKNLIQQGYTLLLEGIFTLFAAKFNLNFKIKDDREIVSKILTYVLTMKKDKESEDQKTSKYIYKTYKKQLKQSEITSYLQIYNFLEPKTDFRLALEKLNNNRNAINHGGFSKGNEQNAKSFADNLKDCWKTIEPFLEELEKYEIPEVVLPEAIEPQLFLLFNHNLTNSQVTAVHQDLNVNSIVPLPDELKTLWGNIPPEAVHLDLKPLETWLNTESHYQDYVLIQGDMGAVYHMVEWCMLHGLQPIYATSERKVTEITDGDQVIKQAVFEHVRFRRYSKPKNNTI